MNALPQRGQRDVLMAINSPSPQKVQSIDDSLVVGVPLVHVRMTGGQVGSYETEASVVVLQSDANSALVTGHATQSSLCSD